MICTSRRTHGDLCSPLLLLSIIVANLVPQATPLVCLDLYICSHSSWICWPSVKHQTQRVMACHHQLIQLAYDADVERLCANVQRASLDGEPTPSDSAVPLTSFVARSHSNAAARAVTVPFICATILPFRVRTIYQSSIILGRPPRLACAG